MKRNRLSLEAIEARHVLIGRMMQFAIKRAGQTKEDANWKDVSFDAGAVCGIAEALERQGIISREQLKWCQDFVFEFCQAGWTW